MAAMFFRNLAILLFIHGCLNLATVTGRPHPQEGEGDQDYFMSDNNKPQNTPDYGEPEVDPGESQNNGGFDDPSYQPGNPAGGQQIMEGNNEGLQNVAPALENQDQQDSLGMQSQQVLEPTFEVSSMAPGVELAANDDQQPAENLETEVTESPENTNIIEEGLNQELPQKREESLGGDSVVESPFPNNVETQQQIPAVEEELSQESIDNNQESSLLPLPTEEPREILEEAMTTQLPEITIKDMPKSRNNRNKLSNKYNRLLPTTTSSTTTTSTTTTTTTTPTPTTNTQLVPVWVERAERKHYYFQTGWCRRKGDINTNEVMGNGCRGIGVGVVRDGGVPLNLLPKYGRVGF